MEEKKDLGDEFLSRAQQQMAKKRQEILEKKIETNELDKKVNL